MTHIGESKSTGLVAGTASFVGRLLKGVLTLAWWFTGGLILGVLWGILSSGGGGKGVGSNYDRDNYQR